MCQGQSSKLHKGIPIIETKRLKLRNFKIDDANEYYYYHMDSDTLRFYDWKPESISDAEVDIESIIRDYENLNRIHWAITLKDNDTIIGDIGILIDSFGFKGEINYMLSKYYWGMGIMSEVLSSVISFIFRETELIRIQALSVPENQPSGNLLKRTGFNSEGLLKKYGHNTITNQPIDLTMWSLLKSEYKSLSPSKSPSAQSNIQIVP